MSKTGIEGATQKLVGEAQEGVGKALHDDKLIAKGVANRAAGTAKESVGKAKDVINKATR
jgi:uncharacterized protein YjbJ (UPF0337 family)